MTVFESILVLLILGIVTSAFCRRIQMPVIVGYLAVGAVIGPHTLAIVTDNESVRGLAEIGLVFLMFAIGLEFSLSKLIQMKRAVFAYGLLEVVLAAGITTGAGLAMGMTLNQSLVIGCIIAMSSTAMVTKQLLEQQELVRRHGLNSVGILLFQDLAVIPILILIPSLLASQSHGVALDVGIALIKGAGAMVVIWLLGRKILRPLFFTIAKLKTREIFTFTVLFVVLGSAWLTHKLGLSMPLGAFMAGMMLGETEYRHQIEGESRPFQDVLLAFFFMTIGMQFNPQVAIEAWPWMLSLFVALVFFKTILIALIGIGLKEKPIDSFRTGIILAHGGEFGLAILSLAMTYRLLPDLYGQVALGGLLLSMLVAPIGIRYNQRMTAWLGAYFAKGQAPLDTQPQSLEGFPTEIQNHVIICGFGRVGQNIAKFLSLAKIQYVAFDLDPLRVQAARLAGEPVFYADIGEHHHLHAAHLAQAKALVVSFYDIADSLKLIGQVRLMDSKIPIIARAHDDSQAAQLIEKGATEVIAEILETSLMLASHLLLFMRVNPTTVFRLMEQTRLNRYDLLRMVFPSTSESVVFDPNDQGVEGLAVVVLSEAAFAVGKTLSELNLKDRSVKITAIRRGAERITDPKPDCALHSNDILVAYGKYPDLDWAENYLLAGML